jgi:GAF domain-containing protein
MTVTNVDAARLFLNIAHDLMTQPDLAATHDRIVSMACKVTGCESASIFKASSPEAWSLGAGTDADLAARLAHILAVTSEGPMLEAQATGRGVSSPALEQELRWPEYAQRVVSVTPIRSEVAYPLRAGGHDFGVLVLQATAAGYFNEDECAIAELFAGHAAMALMHASERNKTANLEVALTSNREIGKAIGILVATHRITEQLAFDALRAESQHAHRKLRDVASDVVLTGEVPSLALHLRRQQSPAGKAVPAPRRLVIV